MKTEKDFVLDSLKEIQPRYANMKGFLKKWTSPSMYANETLSKLLDGLEESLIESHNALIKLKNFNNIAEYE